MICVHCNNLYLLFPLLRTFISQILSTWFTTPLQISAQISCSQRDFFQQCFKKTATSSIIPAPDPALFFSVALITLLNVSVYSVSLPQTVSFFMADCRVPCCLFM